MKPLFSDTASVIFSTAIGLLLFAFLAGDCRFWSTDGTTTFPSANQLCVLAIGALAIALVWARLKGHPLKPDPAGFGLIIVLLFISDWLTRGYNLFPGPTIRGELLLAMALGALAIRRGLWRPAVSILLLLSVCMLWTNFSQTANGRLLTSDDHSSFIFRLSLLSERFPHIPFYYPFWNGGLDARDFFATGSLNVFLLFYPLFLLANTETVYNLVVSCIAFVVIPGATFLAARELKMRASTAALAALLALSSTLLLYRWGLKYGTMGFFTTAALVPLNLAFACRVLQAPDEVSWKRAGAAVITFTLMLFWSPSALMFIPVAGLGLLRIPTLLRAAPVRAFVIAVLLLNLPWMAVFITVSKVAQFSTIEASAKGTAGKPAQFRSRSALLSPAELIQIYSEDPSELGQVIKNASNEIVKHVRENAISTNPLILIFGLPGMLLLGTGARRAYLATAGWLFFLGTVVAFIKPQLEFERMLVVLALVAAVPAAQALSALLDRVSAPRSTPFEFWPAALSFGFVVVGPLVTTSIVKNRSVEQIHFASENLWDLARIFKEHAQGGRVLFSGFVLHELDQGHLAPLSVLSSTPIIASSPFHNVWRYRQVFPAAFVARKNSGGVEEYLDLYNVSLVLAHEREWREYFQARPDLYENIGRVGPFAIFTRKSFPQSYVLRGEASALDQQTHCITLVPQTAELVLRFNYFPFLQADGCSLHPESLGGDITFIKLSNCVPGEKVIISAVSALERLRGQH